MTGMLHPVKVRPPSSKVIVTITGRLLFSFAASDYTVICTQVLSMIILAFLANLFETILPKGMDLTDIALILLLFCLYMESEDEELLIILLAVIFMN